MSESHTILPAPKLLSLIGIRVTENAITLVAKTSSRGARCPVCMQEALCQGSLSVRKDAH